MEKIKSENMVKLSNESIDYAYYENLGRVERSKQAGKFVASVFQKLHQIPVGVYTVVVVAVISDSLWNLI